VALEQVRDQNVFWVAIVAGVDFFSSPQLSGSFHSGVGQLRNRTSRCQEELLTNKLHFLSPGRRPFRKLEQPYQFQRIYPKDGITLNHGD
jgi:hypothetical protein